MSERATGPIPFIHHQEPGPWPRRSPVPVSSVRAGAAARYGVPSWARAPGESGLSPLLTTTASLAAPALTTELLQATSVTTTAGAPVVSPLFLLLTFTASWWLGGGGCATGSAQWALCAGPVAALCSMAVAGACANEARWGKRSRAQRALAGGGAGPRVAATRWSPGPYCRCSVKRIGACLAVAVSTCTDGVAVVPGC